MSICIECGESACGEEIFTTEKGSITCYYCHSHLNRVNLDGSTARKMDDYLASKTKEWSFSFFTFDTNCYQKTLTKFSWVYSLLYHFVISPWTTQEKSYFLLVKISEKDTWSSYRKHRHNVKSLVAISNKWI